MKVCQRCEHDRIISISGKTSDCFNAQYGEIEHDGYVPYGINIGGGDYIEMNICLNCGQVQGNYPIVPSKVIKSFRETN